MADRMVDGSTSALPYMTEVGTPCILVPYCTRSTLGRTASVLATIRSAESNEPRPDATPIVTRQLTYVSHTQGLDLTECITSALRIDKGITRERVLGTLEGLHTTSAYQTVRQPCSPWLKLHRKRRSKRCNSQFALEKSNRLKTTNHESVTGRQRAIWPSATPYCRIRIIHTVWQFGDIAPCSNKRYTALFPSYGGCIGGDARSAASLHSEVRTNQRAAG